MQQKYIFEGIQPTSLAHERTGASMQHLPQREAIVALDLAGNLAKAHLARCSDIILASIQSSFVPRTTR